MNLLDALNWRYAVRRIGRRLAEDDSAHLKKVRFGRRELVEMV